MIRSLNIHDPGTRWENRVSVKKAEPGGEEETAGAEEDSDETSKSEKRAKRTGLCHSVCYGVSLRKFHWATDGYIDSDYEEEDGVREEAGITSRMRGRGISNFRVRQAAKRDFAKLCFAQFPPARLIPRRAARFFHLPVALSRACFFRGLSLSAALAVSANVPGGRR